MSHHTTRRACAPMASLLALCASAAIAQPLTPKMIAEMTIVDVPLVLGDVAPLPAGSTLWANGQREEATLLTTFAVRPAQAAALPAPSGGGAPVLLWRAFTGGGTTILRADELPLTGAPRHFCGIAAGAARPVCFVDEDGDDRFDKVAVAVTERGEKPYHVTMIGAAKPLGSPLPYRLLTDDQRPAIEVRLRNCAKDYDRPRFTVLSAEDRDVSPSLTGFDWQEKDSTFARCRRGLQLPTASGAAPVPAGGYLAQMGPLTFTVGPKKNPVLALAGPAGDADLYRLEGANLVAMKIGRTPGQAQLVSMKKFPYSMLMADEGGSLHAGPLAPGGRVASIPFHHAYRGRLTQDISISTLLGKRSVAAGTVVYGFPATSKLTVTVRGMPAGAAVGDDEYRKINRDLTWCAPVRGPAPPEIKPNAQGRGGWSAACIPHSIIGNHTILTDLQPAFAVSAMSYAAGTASNDGPPPIQRDDEGAFGQPLRVDYVYEGRSDEFIELRERIFFGEELTSERPLRLYAPSGTVIVQLAGAQAELSVADTGLKVTPSGAPQAGLNPILQWDEEALLLQQIRRMGLRPAKRDEAKAPAAPGEGAPTEPR